MLPYAPFGLVNTRLPTRFHCMPVRAKLIVGALVLLGVTIYVAYLGASSSWQYYLTVDECAANISQIAGRRVRVSGLVAPGSLEMGRDRKRATFVLQGTSSGLATVCDGPLPLPDNLAEGITVVVEGSVAPTGSLQAEKVLTRCASKYESQQ
jgi:cytochrome c-type biogenesis protein CcmE